jgi:hypothetical protein
MQKHFSAAQNVLLALAVIALGAYVLMAGQAFKAPGWIAVLCGGAFIVCGLLLLSRGLAPDGKFSGPLPADTPFWLRASQYVAVVALFGIFGALSTWIAFGPGTRIFNMSVPWFVPEQASESMGRIAFGASAAIAWFCTATIAVQGGRKLFAKADR